jgi:type I restriction enzyme, S subunit
MSARWENKRLAEVLEIQSGYAFKSKHYTDTGHFLIRIGNVQDGFISLEKPKYVELDNKTKRYELKAGDLLTSLTGNIGRVAKVEKIHLPAALNQRVARLTRKADVHLDDQFLHYFLTSDQFREPLMGAGHGAAQQNVSPKAIGDVTITIPPLPEQKRIVAILDEAFEAIDKAMANTEKNLANARELFNTFLNSVFLEGSADAWPMRRLGDVFEIGSSKRIHERDWSPSGVPFYGGKEIVKLANFGHAESNAFISEEKYQDYASKYDMPKSGDILITARGTIGVGYVVQKSDKFYYKDGNIISMRAKIAANPHYLLYAFRSNALAQQLGDLSGTTVTHLPIKKAKELLLRMPEIDTQNLTVQQIIEFEGEAQRLEGIYERKMTGLAALKQSLLHQAFSGSL